MASTRTRARARMLMEQEQEPDISFGAGINMDQIHNNNGSGLPHGKPGLLGAYLDKHPPSGRTKAQIAGALAGTISSGGNPLGGAAGFALGDKLYGKYHDDEEITPLGTAKTFAEGAAYEVAPKVALKALSTLIPKDMAISLMQRALRAPIDLKPSYTEKIAQYALDHNLAISKSQINKSAEIFRKNADLINKRVAELGEQGVTVDPMEVVAGMRKSLKDPFEGVSMSGPDRLKADKMADEFLTELRDTYGVQAGTSYPNSIPIEAAQAAKRADDSFASNAHTQAVKTNTPIQNPNRVNARRATADGYRGVLNRDQIIAAANKETHERMLWAKLAGDRARKQGTTSLIPSEIIMPAAMETMTKGGPGIATLLGVSRAASSHPYLLSKAGLAVNTMKTNPGKYVPNLHTDLLIKELFKKKNKTKKKKGGGKS